MARLTLESLTGFAYYEDVPGKPTCGAVLYGAEKQLCVELVLGTLGLYKILSTSSWEDVACPQLFEKPAARSSRWSDPLRGSIKPTC